MKILFNNNNLSGLVSFRIDIINHFIENGHDVVLVAPGHDPELEKKIPVAARFISVSGNRTSANVADNLIYFKQLYKIFKKERPDYVFNYTVKPNVYGSMAAKLLGIPNTCMLAGLGYAFAHNDFKSKVARFLYRVSLRCTQHVMLLNEGNCNTIVSKHLCKQDKIIWLKGGEGVNLTNYPMFDNSSDQVSFVFIGRLIPEKGYREFVEASRVIKEKYPNVKFLVVGGLDIDYPDAIQKDEIERDVANGYIEYLGQISNMLEVYNREGLVVAIPSYYSEGLNRSLMEACSCGKPVITTTIDGCKETVKDGVNGYLVEPRDVNSLVEAIEKYIELSQERKNQMSIESRKLAEMRFDVENVITVYDCIVSNTQRVELKFS